MPGKWFLIRERHSSWRPLREALTRASTPLTMLWFQYETSSLDSAYRIGRSPGKFAWSCRVPLTNTLLLASLRKRRRQDVFVRIETQSRCSRSSINSSRLSVFRGNSLPNNLFIDTFLMVGTRAEESLEGLPGLPVLSRSLVVPAEILRSPCKNLAAPSYALRPSPRFAPNLRQIHGPPLL